MNRISESTIILATIFVIMRVPDIELGDFNESSDNWPLDSDDDAAGGLDGDDMAPAVVPDTDDFDTETPDATTMKEQRIYG
nr:unnamed protein product [Haemonchus contortus]